MLAGRCSAAAAESAKGVAHAIPPAANGGAGRVHRSVGGGELIVDAADHVVDLLQTVAELRECQPGLVERQGQDGLDRPQAAGHVQEGEGGEETEQEEPNAHEQDPNLPDHYPILQTVSVMGY